MGSRRRCCCGACFEWHDYFTRSDSTNLGDDWEEKSGDWEIKSNHLYEPGTSGAFVRTTKLVPPRSAGEMYAAVTASGFVSGQECEVFAAYDEDTNTYWKGTYTKDNATPGGTWTVSLYKNTDLLDTAICNPMPYYIDDSNWGLGSDTDHVRCWICVDNRGNAKAGVYGGSEPAWSIENGGTIGRGAGIRHTNSIATNVDDFAMEELHDTKEECYACWCSCCGNLLSPRLTATIVNSTGRAACLEGDEVDLLWLWDGGLQHREGTITHVRGVYSNTFAMSLACESHGDDASCTGQNITLTLVTQCAEIGGFVCSTACVLHPTTDSTCNPLNLIFGPYLLKSTMLSCSACYGPGFVLPGEPTEGEFYIVVTESAADEMFWEDDSTALWEDGEVRHWG